MGFLHHCTHKYIINLRQNWREISKRLYELLSVERIIRNTRRTSQDGRMLCFFLFWKAKQINMRVFFGVGRTIERMMALPKLFPFFLQISDPIFNHQIMGLFKQLINISLIDSYKFIIITQSQLMQPNLKWSQQEDELLMASVAKHGTQWGLVVKQMNNIRSQNAVIKRWHGYIRKNLNGEIPQTKPKTIQQEKVEGTPSKNEKKRKVSQSSDSQSMKDQNQQRAKTEKENTEQIKKIQEEVYQYKLNWSEEDDIKLKNFIINDGKLSWNELAGLFNTTQLEVMARWIKFICPKLKHNVKIGGAVKWSVNEDYILYAADRNKVSHLALMYFLPYRTVYSIEARWRRICKNSDIMNHLTVVNNRNNLRRDTLKKIAIKRCLQKRDSMSKIYEKQREIMEKQRQEQQKYDMMRRQDKMRKIQRM